MTEPIIFIDMDGVVANFVQATLDLMPEIELTHDDVTEWNYYRPFMSDREFEQRIDACEGFWEHKIEPYPWAECLIGKIYEAFGSDRVYFCSSPNTHVNAPSGKVQWLRNHGFIAPEDSNFIITRHKYLLAGPDRWLIDDSGEHGTQFKAAGGNWYPFPQPWTSSAHPLGSTDPEVIVSRIKLLSQQATPPQESVLQEAERLTSRDRQAEYGDAFDDYHRVAGMFNSCYADVLKRPLLAHEMMDVMKFVKISRQRVTPQKRDHYVDDNGYTKLKYDTVQKELELGIDLPGVL